MKMILPLVLAFLWTAGFGLTASDALAGIDFWTTEVEKDRLQTQERIAAAFQEKTGVAVRVVPVEENLLAERVTAAYAAKSLPDVIFHPVDFTIGWSEAGILDGGSASEVVDALGRETFAAGPLNLVKTPAGLAAVPADGWGQLLLLSQGPLCQKGVAGTGSLGAHSQGRRSPAQPAPDLGL